MATTRRRDLHWLKPTRRSRLARPFTAPIARTALLLALLLATVPAVRVDGFHPDGVIYVDDSAPGLELGISWLTAYTSLQAALDHAESGDEIWVAEGVYRPSRQSDADDPRSATFQLENGVAIYGGFAGDETARSQRDWQANRTVLSGDLDRNDRTDPDGVVTSTAAITAANSYHVVTGSGADDSAVLDGVTVTAGRAYETASVPLGGGMLNERGSPTLRNLTFRGNLAGAGGGMYNAYGSPILRNVTFHSNLAIDGSGGIENRYGSISLRNVTFERNDSYTTSGGMRSWLSHVRLRHVVFRHNRGNAGGGLDSVGGTAVLRDVTFERNFAYYDGGMTSSGTVTLTNVTFNGSASEWGSGGMFSTWSAALTNVTFNGNRAGSFGGGMENFGKASLLNVTFSGNSAEQGGGLANYHEDVTLQHVTFTSNTATKNGGGLFNNTPFGSATLANVTFAGNSAARGGGMYNLVADTILVNASFTGNEATEYGGGIYNSDGSPTLTNVTLTGNVAASGGGGLLQADPFDRGLPHVRNSIVWGNAPDQIFNAEAAATTAEYSLIQGGYAGTGNRVGNPRFVDANGADNIHGTLDDNLRLGPTSPAIDAGNNELVPDDTIDLDGDDDRTERLPFDLAGAARFVDHQRPNTGRGAPPIVDLGAYEAAATSSTVTPTATRTPTQAATTTPSATSTATATPPTATRTATATTSATQTRPPTTPTRATATQTPAATATRTASPPASPTAPATRPASPSPSTTRGASPSPSGTAATGSATPSPSATVATTGTATHTGRQLFLPLLLR